MVAAANQEGSQVDVSVFEFSAGMSVQEIGWDDDCGDEISLAIEDVLGEELIEEDAHEVVDAIVMWWREDDGDLIDSLMDVVATLTDGGAVWLLTPRTGTQGAVQPSDIAEAAKTVGMAQTKTATLGSWAAARLILGSIKSNKR